MGRKTHGPDQLLTIHAHGSPCLTWPYFLAAERLFQRPTLQAKPPESKLNVHPHLASLDCKTPGPSPHEVSSLSSYFAKFTSSKNRSWEWQPLSETLSGVWFSLYQLSSSMRTGAEGRWPALSTSAPEHTAKAREALCRGSAPSSPDPLAVNQQRNSSGCVLGPQGRTNDFKGSPAAPCSCPT